MRKHANALALALALPCAAAAACTTEVDTSGLEPLDGYDQWPSIEASGPLAGHGDSVRVIYINPVARSYAHGGRYPVGSVLVKEVYRRGDGGGRGDLRYIAVMRRIDEASDEADGLPIDEGWLYTFFDALGDPEVHSESCWASCHRQAPYDGVWFDYGL